MTGVKKNRCLAGQLIVMITLVLSALKSAEATLTGASCGTFAGSTSYGFSGDGGAATSGQFYRPSSIWVSSVGVVYVADTSNNRIRKIEGGMIDTFAGGGSSTADGIDPLLASMTPVGITGDTAGGIYVTDSNGASAIRKISRGLISTVWAGSSGLVMANAAAVDLAGHIYYFNNGYTRIDMVPLHAGGSAIPVAGPPGSGAPLIYPYGFLLKSVAFNPTTNYLYFNLAGGEFYKTSVAALFHVPLGGGGIMGGGSSGPPFVGTPEGSYTYDEVFSPLSGNTFHLPMAVDKHQNVFVSKTTTAFAGGSYVYDAVADSVYSFTGFYNGIVSIAAHDGVVYYLDTSNHQIQTCVYAPPETTAPSDVPSEVPTEDDIERRQLRGSN